MKPHEQSVYRFGAFTLVPSERLLLRDGGAVSMTGKAFDLLVALVRNAGRLVTKDQLLAEVWPGLVVEEVNLSVNMSAVRKALAVDSGGVEWIETVPRQGYRFNAPIAIADVATVDLAALRGLPPYRGDAEPPSSARASWRPRAIVGLGILLVAAAVLAGAYRLLPTAAPYASVAVLPFTVEAPGDAYLADGMAESVINGLTKIHGLRVVPRASAFRFKAAAPDPLEAGRKLGAAAVVTGSLVRRDGGLKLQVELVDVSSRAQVWSGAYEAAGTQLPRLEGRVMHDLAQAMRVRLTGAESGVLARAATSNPDAYRAYLEGRFLWNQRSEEGLTTAIGRFQKAMELDPGFALAYAALADAHTTLGYLGYVPPVNAFPVARPYALKALELDPSLAQAHASLAYIKFYFDWDWEGARSEFRRALELNRDDPVSHQWYAVFLLAAGQPDEAMREIQAAHRLDPLSLAINTDIGFHHYYNARYDEAAAQLQLVLAMKSDFLAAHLWLARTYLALGRFDEAIKETAFAEGKAREWPVLVAARGFTYGMSGRSEEARAVLREMEELSGRRFVTAYGMALVHAGLGRKEDAFRWLEKAFEERSHWLVWLRLDPRWSPLRDDPRFPALVARMKYPA